MNWKTVLALGGLGLIVYMVIKKDAAAAAAAVGSALNPVSQGNIVNQGVNAVVTAVSSNPTQPTSLGSAIYDFLNPTAAAYDPNQPNSAVQ